MKKNTKIMIAGSIIFIAIIYILLMATPSLSSTELTIEEILIKNEELQGRYITTQGLLIEESIQWNPDKLEINFQIEDEHGNVISIFHNGVIPDNFSDGMIIIVKGLIQENNVFNAEKILTSCPSKYESESPEDYDINLHKQILETSKNN